MIYADVGETTKIMAYFTSKLSNFNLKSTQINSNFNSNWLNITKYILHFFSFGNWKFESLEIGNFQLFQISKFPTFSIRFTHFITKKRAIFNDKTYLNWPNNLWQIYYLGKSLYVFFWHFFWFVLPTQIDLSTYVFQGFQWNYQIYHSSCIILKITQNRHLKVGEVEADRCKQTVVSFKLSSLKTSFKSNPTKLHADATGSTT